MDLLTLIKERRSVRQFLKEPIPHEDLEEILEAAQWAPSGGNKQGWKFIVIKNPDLLDEMSKMVGDKIDKLAEEAGLGNKLKGNKVMATFNQAPVTIVVFMERYISKIEEALEGLGYQPLEIQRLRGQSIYKVLEQPFRISYLWLIAKDMAPVGYVVPILPVQK